MRRRGIVSRVEESIERGTGRGRPIVGLTLSVDVEILRPDGGTEREASAELQEIIARWARGWTHLSIATNIQGRFASRAEREGR